MHAAVAGEKVAAETLRDAVSLVLTHELARVKLKHTMSGHWPVIMWWPSYLEDGHPAGVTSDLTIEVTLDIVQVLDPGEAGGALVDAQQPLHVAVAEPGVAAQQKLGKLGCN